MAQSDGYDSSAEHDISIERLSTVLPNLPLPRFTSSTLTHRPAVPESSPSYLASGSPWDTSPRTNGTPRMENLASPYGIGHDTDRQTGSMGEDELDGMNPAAQAEKGYWKRLERVDVRLVEQKEGWFLQKYHVESDVSVVLCGG